MFFQHDYRFISYKAQRGNVVFNYKVMTYHFSSNTRYSLSTIHFLDTAITELIFLTLILQTLKNCKTSTESNV